MRVAMLVRCLNMMRGGGETRHLAWARELRGLGVDVDLVAGTPLAGAAKCPMPAGECASVRSPYLRDAVYRVQRQRGFGRLSSLMLHLDDRWFVDAAWRHLAELRQRPDVVHAHALHEAASRRRFDVPVVVNLPGAPHARYTDVLRSSDALVADGWAAANLPKQLGLPVDDVPKGVDTRLFTPAGEDVRSRLGLGSAPVVLGVARMVPIKRVGLLMDAFRRRCPTDAHLVLVGDGPERRQLEKRAAAWGCADRMHFAGAVPHDQLPKWYRAADVFALSSVFDNSPNVVLEAMASGLPVVASDVGGVSRYVTHGVNGLLVPSDDVEEFGAALTTLLTDVARSRAIGERNRAHAVKSFSWRASAERLLAVYERLLGRRSARPDARRAVRA